MLAGKANKFKNRPNCSGLIYNGLWCIVFLWFNYLGEICLLIGINRGLLDGLLCFKVSFLLGFSFLCGLASRYWINNWASPLSSFFLFCSLSFLNNYLMSPKGIVCYFIKEALKLIFSKIVLSTRIMDVGLVFGKSVTQEYSKNPSTHFHVLQQGYTTYRLISENLKQLLIVIWLAIARSLLLALIYSLIDNINCIHKL